MLRWPGDSQRESGRLARIDSRESKRPFSKHANDSCESPQTCDSQLLALRSAIRNNGVQFGNPETIRENQAIRANLRIDSRESGHLSWEVLNGVGVDGVGGIFPFFLFFFSFFFAFFVFLRFLRFSSFFFAFLVFSQRTREPTAIYCKNGEFHSDPVCTDPVQNFPTNRERKLNPNFFFSNFSGTPGISRQNPGISRQKSLISLVSRGIPNFLAPTPSCGRPLPHRKISGLKSLGLGSFFVPELSLNDPRGSTARRFVSARQTGSRTRPQAPSSCRRSS